MHSPKESVYLATCLKSMIKPATRVDGTAWEARLAPSLKFKLKSICIENLKLACGRLFDREVYILILYINSETPQVLYHSSIQGA